MLAHLGSFLKAGGFPMRFSVQSVKSTPFPRIQEQRQRQDMEPMLPPGTREFGRQARSREQRRSKDSFFVHDMKDGLPQAASDPMLRLSL